tara:strand:+ start:569 stop:1183 length:615 start_codon:yes stop_codon:yes gene_type:complete
MSRQMPTVKEIHNNMHEGCFVLVDWKDKDNQVTRNVKVKLTNKNNDVHGWHTVVWSDEDYKFKIASGGRVGITAVVPGFSLPSVRTTPHPSGTKVGNLVLHVGSEIRVMDPEFQPGTPIIGVYSAVVTQLKLNKIEAVYLKNEWRNTFDWFKHRHVTGMMKKGYEDDVKKIPNPDYVAPVAAVVVPTRKSNRTSTPSKRLVEEN